MTLTDKHTVWRGKGSYEIVVIAPVCVCVLCVSVSVRESERERGGDMCFRLDCEKYSEIRKNISGNFLNL